MTQRFMTKSPNINVMVKAAQKAARILRHDFGELENLQATRKSLGDFVSRADRNSERAIMEELQKARPDYGFLVEESGEVPGKNEHFRWIVDPLDGTSNFLHGVPYFAISIALEQDHEIVAGVIYDPIRDELFWAEKGNGAFLNNTRIRVSGRKDLDTVLLASGEPYSRRAQNKDYVEKISKIALLVCGVRRMGASALDLAYVAAGRYDMYFEDCVTPWDYAAGIILVREAGGVVCDHTGHSKISKRGDIYASSLHFKELFMKIV